MTTQGIIAYRSVIVYDTDHKKHKCTILDHIDRENKEVAHMLSLEGFAARLEDVRREKGLTQDAMAKELGIARMSYVYYENAKRTPDVEFLSNLSEFTGYSADYLLGKDECTTLGNEAIHEQLAISDKAIDSLRALKRDSYAHPSAAGLILTINELLTTKHGREALEYLYLYLNSDFTTGYKDDSDALTGDNSISTLTLKGSRLHANDSLMFTAPVSLLEKGALEFLLDAVKDMRKVEVQSNAQQTE